MDDDDAARLLALGEALQLAAYECRADGTMTVASLRLCDLAGRRCEELLREPLHALCDPADRERVRAAREGARPGERLVLEYYLAGAEGPVPVRDVAAARGGPDGVTLVGAIEDLRAERRREALVAEQARRQAMADLAAGVAHEVNNALSGVLNFATLAQRAGPGSPHLGEALDGIVAEGRRILEITRALATYAQRGEATLAPGELFRAALAPVRRQLRDELIALSLDVDADAPPLVVRGDELQTSVLYLIERARRSLAGRAATRERSTLTLRARCDEDHVVLEVEAAPALPDDDPGAAALARARELVAEAGGTLQAEPGVARARLPL